ncbi:MAG: demethoxyubiquinone hydroxylase family protein [Proteobacteria bacterium]|nr:demethoxyubiquinone hydroxylase family protein [Pseudomonadota bacterium]
MTANKSKASKTKRRLGRLPGDPSEAETLARMIRVDQAGEYGAKRIYEGQLAVLGNSKDGPVLRDMAATEQVHLDTFNRIMTERQVRPTVLQPLWHVAGFALGAGTALLGPRAAMACTVAVEEVIEEHYADQAAALGDNESELRGTIEKFRDEELEHKETALEHGAEQAPAYPALSAAVKTGSRLAIWLSERF